MSDSGASKDANSETVNRFPNGSFEIRLTKRALSSVSSPQPDASVHENYWAEVYHDGNRIMEMSSVHVKYPPDLFDDPDVSFPGQFSIKHRIDAEYDVEAIKQAIKNKLIEQIRQSYEPVSESYDPGVIPADDL